VTHRVVFTERAAKEIAGLDKTTKERIGRAVRRLETEPRSKSRQLSHKKDLLAGISSKSATVGVIGLGYVGLPLALVFEEAGFPVLGFGHDPDAIGMIAPLFKRQYPGSPRS